MTGAVAWIAAGVGLIAGCVVLPQPPPILAPDGKATLGATWGYVAAPVKVVASTPSDAPVTLTQKTDGLSGALLFDPRASFSGAVAPGWALGGHLSWTTAGLELRALVSEDPKRLVALTLGGQVDGPLLWSRSSEPRAYPGFAWEARVGVTIQPELTDRVQLLLGVGASVGPRRHSVVVADDTLGSGHGDGLRPVPELRLLRPELRAEGLFGVLVRPSWAATPWLGFVVAAQPYVVAHAGDLAGVSCRSCSTAVVVESFSSTLGVAVTGTLVIGGPRRH